MQNHSVVCGASAFVAPNRDLEDGRDGEDDDQHVESPPARDLSDPAHALNVLLALGGRLLPG